MYKFKIKSSSINFFILIPILYYDPDWPDYNIFNDKIESFQVVNCNFYVIITCAYLKNFLYCKSYSIILPIVIS